ncbi:MAG: hydroxymethylglutaryl-CoA synthase family protein [Ramlibacter sp.]
MIGITGFGGYVPRLRLSRQAVAQANAWYAPQFGGRKGTRAMAGYDEDSITMAVAAARDCLGPGEDRSHVRSVFLASDTLPFAERLNAGVVAGALTLAEDIEAIDMGGTQRAALSAITQAVARVQSGGGDALVLAADNRQTRAGSAQELEYGDAAAAVLVGSDKVLAEYLGGAALTVDFVDHFRAAGEDIDYHWEERWVRDEGIARLGPRAIGAALEKAGLQAAEVDHFIFPSTFAKMDAQLARACGIRAEAVVDNLAATVGDSGLPHGLLLLAHVLERARPGQAIVLAQFGSGAQALVFRVTDAIAGFRPARGVGQWLARGVEERNYTKFLSFKGQLALERGMRGEQDKKTALSTAWRHRSALLGLVAGRCEVTGSVHFPPSRLSYDQGKPLQDTQRPYKLADRQARVLSWSAEYLSYHPAPPHHYGQVDFDGGGRLLMDFTDLDIGEVDAGTAMEMVFRVKDIDERRGFTRYFWKATPVRA